MAIIGDYFTVVLQEVHLNWGTTSRTGTRYRHPDEAYIPISSDVAISLDLPNDGTLFNVQGQTFQVRATGTQSNSNYGKNLTSSGNLKLLGRYLKGVLNARPGDIVRVAWLSDTEVSITLE